MTEQKKNRRNSKSQLVDQQQELNLEVVSDAIDISPFITNSEGHVYAVTNLPEEFVAVLFAWVSRSPKSFKEHLAEAIREGFIKPDGALAYKESSQALSEKSAKFHEKWTVGYGHSSVAEHAVAHVGIENVSRLASAELELSNQFYSITEYSQRYQKPQRGDWFNPFPKSVSHKGPTRDMIPNPEFNEFEAFMEDCYDAFELLIKGVYEYLVEQHEGDLTKKDLAAYEKLAFEDARYVLPLAMHTQLGMTANGRAWRDGIVELYNSDYAEVRELADDLKGEITKVLPTLLKYAVPSQYKKNSKIRTNDRFKKKPYSAAQDDPVTILSQPSEEKAINNIIADLFVEKLGIPHREAYQRALLMTREETLEVLRDLLFEIGPHDNPPDVFKDTQYKVQFLVSEANWHQLLRHNRKVDFTYAQPSPYNGLTIPPRIIAAGLDQVVQDLAQRSQDYYAKLQSIAQELAPYVVLNAHRRRVIARFDLWEAYHLINLRTSEEAQWDIREAFNDLFQKLIFIHPVLIETAKRR